MVPCLPALDYDTLFPQFIQRRTGNKKAFGSVDSGYQAVQGVFALFLSQQNQRLCW